MKKNKKLPKLNILTIISVVIIAFWCVIGVFVGINMYRISEAEKSRLREDKLQSVYNLCESLMLDGSDTLTNSARQYVYSGNTEYMDTYFTEVNETKSRDRALELLDEENAEDLYGELNNAMQQSRELMNVEYHAMRLRAEADGVAPASLPDPIGKYSLPAEEKGLSKEEKKALALDLMLNDRYTELKEEIWGSAESFLTNAIENTSAERNKLSDEIEKSMRLQSLLFFLFAAGIVYIACMIISYLRMKKTNEKALSREVERQAETIKEAYRNQSRLQDGIINGMAKLVEGRDMNTGAHIQNTRAYVSMIVRRLEEDGQFPDSASKLYAEQVVRASVLHDVGKIFISDFLLNKPGKLTQDEFDIMKKHTSLGGEIVDDLFGESLEEEMLKVVRDIVVHHHERWDGAGYPDGLKGTQIPLAARIMAVADVFDALTSKRPYKDPIDAESALMIMQHERGRQFDPAVVDAFSSLREQLAEYVGKNAESDEQETIYSAFRQFEEQVQQESVISGLSNDYEAVFYVKPDDENITILRVSEYMFDVLSGKDQFMSRMSFADFKAMIREKIFSEDMDFCDAVLSSAEGIRGQLAESIVKKILIRLMHNDVPLYYQVKLIRLGKEGEANFDVLLGLTNVDAETHKRMQEAEELAEAKKIAETANAAKTDFMLNASRALRTLVNNIVGYTGMLEKHFGEGEASRKYLEKVVKYESELTKMLDVTLDMETIESGGQTAAAADSGK